MAIKILIPISIISSCRIVDELPYRACLAGRQARNEDKKLLSIYFTSGYPEINDTVEIIKSLEKNGVDFIEIGLPFSDPLADGPTIQESSTIALKSGMTTNKL